MDKSEIKNLIKELIEKTTVPIREIVLNEENPKVLWFSVNVSEPYFFIAHGGEVLFALNHIIRRMIETKIPIGGDGKKEFEILIDVNDFQKKRVENVHAIAHMMAERARYFKSSIEVEPMPAYERRIVHEFLSNESDLKTESTGEGPSRRVVIKYIGTI